MNRTLIRKILFPVVIFAGVAGLVFLARSMNLPLWQVILICLVLLIPGRIAGMVYRDFFRGLNLLQKEEWDRSREHFDTFITMIRANPGRKKFIWLLWGMYTGDIEAMALNNRGIIFLHAGAFDAARADLEQAVELDPLYSKAFFNLALLEYVLGNHRKAEQNFAHSEELGFKGSTYDQLIEQGTMLLARIEGNTSLQSP